jgi:hypothetical protein
MRARGARRHDPLWEIRLSALRDVLSNAWRLQTRRSARPSSVVRHPPVPRPVVARGAPAELGVSAGSFGCPRSRCRAGVRRHRRPRAPWPR